MITAPKAVRGFSFGSIPALATLAIVCGEMSLAGVTLQAQTVVANVSDTIG